MAFCCLTAAGSPFAQKIPFTQPDGTQFVLWGQGDEFYADFETLDGYTVIFNLKTLAYDYATLSADGEQLVSTGLVVGRDDPATLKLKPHVRIKPEARRKQASERRARWDEGMGITRGWNRLKSEHEAAEAAAEAKKKDGVAPPEMAPPPFTTTGQKLGLTLLIDFSDAPGTTAVSEFHGRAAGWRARGPCRRPS